MSGEGKWGDQRRGAKGGGSIHAILNMLGKRYVEEKRSEGLEEKVLAVPFLW